MTTSVPANTVVTGAIDGGHAKHNPPMSVASSAETRIAPRSQMLSPESWTFYSHAAQVDVRCRACFDRWSFAAAPIEAALSDA